MRKRALHWRQTKLAFRLICSTDRDDREATAAVFREVEDIHRDLGHDFYDWRQHGGTYEDFTSGRHRTG